MRFRRPFVAAGIAGSLLAGATGQAWATAAVTSARLAGADRYATAQAVAKATFTSSTVAILVSGESFADALPAAYLSGAERAPLFTTPRATLPAGLIATLDALKVDGIQIVGGTASVSAEVVTQLEATGLSVERLAGNDRYETARKVAELLPKESVGSFQAGPAAIVVSGTSFADALAAGPMSASNGFPILLTNPNGLHNQATAALRSLGIKQALIIGGTGAVSQSSEDQIKALGIVTRRIAGANRGATSAAVARVEKGELKYAMTTVELARSDQFADALVGGTRGGQIFGPVLLTGATLGAEVRQFLKDNAATITTIDALGGEGAVPGSVVAEAVAAATG